MAVVPSEGRHGKGVQAVGELAEDGLVDCRDRRKGRRGIGLTNRAGVSRHAFLAAIRQIRNSGWRWAGCRVDRGIEGGREGSSCREVASRMDWKTHFLVFSEMRRWMIATLGFRRLSYLIPLSSLSSLSVVVAAVVVTAIEEGEEGDANACWMD